ncbi:glycosyltransferase [Candidatus Gracilibacteria bacterium]|nr:glycosyltransferase [Candidatus Gracilibacteria bacterium]
MKKLLIFTDTYTGQINGVTRCLDNLASNLPSDIHLSVVSSDDFLSVPFLGYKEIRLSLAFPRRIISQLRDVRPDYVHIMTEGPIGLTVAYICQKRYIPYTTTFHTKYPEYLNMRNSLIKEEYVHQYLHYIHNSAEEVFISNSGLGEYLVRNGYEHSTIVPFGIDHTIFYPGVRTLFLDIPRPILLYVGRIAVEKNIVDFLEMDTRYAKIIVGDGPLLEEYREKYSDIQFLGQRSAVELGEIYRSVDAFVFPSKTDTLGLVNLEAMACGLPIIAYDLENTRCIIENDVTGILVPEGKKLETAIEKISNILPRACAESVAEYTWKNYANEFISHQFPISKTLWTSTNI